MSDKVIELQQVSGGVSSTDDTGSESSGVETFKQNALPKAKTNTFLDAPSESEISDSNEDDYTLPLSSKNSMRKSQRHRKDEAKIRRVQTSMKDFHKLSFKEVQDLLLDYQASLLERRKGTIHPEGIFMRYWDAVLMVCLAITASLTPFEVSFLKTDFDFLFFFNRIIDLIFVADIIINFHLAYMGKVGWVYDRKLIAMKYFKGWFLLDFVSILPFELLSVLFDSDTLKSLAIVRILKLMRLIKLMRIFRASRLLERWESQMSISYAILSLWKLALTIATVIHWAACAWAFASEISDAEENWLEAYGFDDETTFTKYLTSVYWSTYTATTIGYGDIGPQGSTERFCAIILMLVGALVYALLVGSFCGIIQSLDTATVEYQNSMDELNVYMKEQNASDEMRIAYRRYFMHCQDMHRDKQRKHVLLLMSDGLRGEFTQHSLGTWLAGLDFLKGSPVHEREKLNTRISMCLVTRNYPPREAIISTGSKATELYVVKSGLVARLGRILSKGKLFGEDVILHNGRRNYSVLTLTYVTALELSKADLDHILYTGDFSGTIKAIRRYAVRLALRREFIEHAKKHLSRWKKRGIDVSKRQELTGLADRKKRKDPPTTSVLQSLQNFQAVRHNLLFPEHELDEDANKNYASIAVPLGSDSKKPVPIHAAISASNNNYHDDGGESNEDDSQHDDPKEGNELQQYDDKTIQLSASPSKTKSRSGKKKLNIKFRRRASNKPLSELRVDEKKELMMEQESKELGPIQSDRKRLSSRSYSAAAVGSVHTPLLTPTPLTYADYSSDSSSSDTEELPPTHPIAVMEQERRKSVLVPQSHPHAIHRDSMTYSYASESEEEDKPIGREHHHHHHHHHHKYRPLAGSSSQRHASQASTCSHLAVGSPAGSRNPSVSHRYSIDSQGTDRTGMTGLLLDEDELAAGPTQLHPALQGRHLHLPNYHLPRTALQRHNSQTEATLHISAELEQKMVHLPPRNTSTTPSTSVVRHGSRSRRNSRKRASLRHHQNGQGPIEISEYDLIMIQDRKKEFAKAIHKKLQPILEKKFKTLATHASFLDMELNELQQDLKELEYSHQKLITLAKRQWDQYFQVWQDAAEGKSFVQLPDSITLVNSGLGPLIPVGTESNYDTRKYVLN